MIYAENQNVKTTPYKPPEGEAGRKFPRQYNRQAASASKAAEPVRASVPAAARISPPPETSSKMPPAQAPSTGGEPLREGPPYAVQQTETMQAPSAPLNNRTEQAPPAPAVQQMEEEQAPPAPAAQESETEPAPPMPAVQQNEPEVRQPMPAAPPPENTVQPAADAQSDAPAPAPQGTSAPAQISEWANPPETPEEAAAERTADKPAGGASDPFPAPVQPDAAFREDISAGQPLTLEQEEQLIEDAEGGPISSDLIDPIPDLTPPGLTREQAEEFPEYYEDAADLRDARPGPLAGEADEPPHEAPQTSTGTILVQVFTARQALPVPGARVTIVHASVDDNTLVGIAMTDRDGRTRPIEVPTPARALSEAPLTDNVIPFSVYDIRVEKAGYYTVNINDVQVFSGEQTLQTVDMTPLAEFADPQSSEDFTVLPQNL